MKAKISRGSGFRGALNYIFDVGKDATGTKNPERVSGNMSGHDPQHLSREFAAIRKLRPGIARPVWHCSLSLPPGERLSSERWDTVASDFMARMEFSVFTPWVAVRHQDTDKDHIHIVASRVGLDGKVWLGQWEARRAIEATQALEQVHSLRLTPGLGEARAERRKPTGKEINMGIRKGEMPPRMYLQKILDAALVDKPTAPELAERLNEIGVGVRANLASTGRMNGFSFELEGIAFKGSDLGKAYTWNGLQKAGVTYDEARDFERLARFKAGTSNTRDHQDATASNSIDARGYENITGENGNGIGAAISLSGFSGEDTSIIPGDNSNTASINRRVNAGNEQESLDGIRYKSRGVRDSYFRDDASFKQNGGDSSTNGGGAGQVYKRAAGDDSVNTGMEAGSGQSAPAIMETSGGLRLSRDSVRVVGVDMLSRFRQASAAKRRNAGTNGVSEHVPQGNAGRARVDSRDRQASRTTDPTAYLEAAGFTVKKEGRHLSIRVNEDEVYRVTQKQDGHWLWCDRYGNKGGDNIELVQEVEPGTAYVEAVYRLIGGAAISQQKHPNTPQHQPPQIPQQTSKSRDQGRAYLESRGISSETIRQAEDVGMVRYVDGGVLFVGYDQAGKAQNVTRRAVTPNDPVQKRDFRGSDKRYPPILLGDPATVWIVEGGADALALYDLFKRKRDGQQPPTVIVSGGANVRSFLERDNVQAILRQAARVVVAGENEKNPEAQAKADDGHQKQASRIAAITGHAPTPWTPKPEQGKDIADMNERQVRSLAQIARQREEAEEIAKERETQRNSRGWRM